MNTKQTSAELTVKFGIFTAIVSVWHKKNDENFAEVVKDSVFNNLFAPHLKWAIEEYLQELDELEKFHNQ